MFDSKYIKTEIPKTNLTHEQGPADMFEYLVKSKKSLQKALKHYTIEEADKALIKDFILGKNPL